MNHLPARFTMTLRSVAPNLLVQPRKSLAKYSIAFDHRISIPFGTRIRAKGNENPSERKNKPSNAAKFTISDVLADPVLIMLAYPNAK